jgi:hypothetical protein
MSAYTDLEAESQEEARDLASLAAIIVDWAGGPTVLPFEEALSTAWKYFNDAATFAAQASVAPVLISLAPAELSAPGADSEIVLSGTGFNAQSVVNWNGGDEATDFISDTELRTTVKPSTVQAPLPFVLPVYVHHAGLQSNTLDFTFVEAGEAKRRQKE